jgi:hypothetical protein
MVTEPAPEFKVMPPAPSVRLTLTLLFPPARNPDAPDVLKVSERANRLPPASDTVFADVLAVVMLKMRSEVVEELGKLAGLGVEAPEAVDHAVTVLQFPVPPSQ